MKKIISITLCILMMLQLTVALSANLNEKEMTDLPLFNPDYEALISRSDLTHNGFILKGSEGIPVANGRFGGPVWQPNKSTLVMQLNHTDCFMYNDASNNTTTEGGCIGQVYVNFGSDVFSNETTQRLSLYDGKLSIDSGDVKVSVIAFNESDVVAIRVSDNRANKSPISIELKMVRQPEIRRGEFSAITSLDTTDPNYAVLKQVFTEKSPTGIEVNDFYCAGALAMTALDKGFEITKPNNQTLKLSLNEATDDVTFIIGGTSTMDDSIDVIKTALDNANNAPDYDGIYSSNQAWWADFWSKSYIYLPSQLDYEAYRNYYMYLAAISNRGNYPSKYNGGIWIGEGDRRDWGAWYWNWNQDSLYPALFDANHIELMDPYYTMRENSFEQYEVAAEQLWGSDGIFVGETSGILGWETLPDDIAHDLREYYAGTGELTPALEAYGGPKNHFLVPWNYKITFSGTSVSWVSHTMVATQETAEHFWNKYCYTKDIEWLENSAYKFIKGAAEMYRNYYGFKKEADGKYHINRTNLHEHLGGATDVIDDLALARGTFSSAIQASEILGVDSELREIWQEILDNLADYPMADEEGALAFRDNNPDNKKIWAQGREPVSYIRGLDGTESPKFKMLEKYDLLNLETRDQKLDNGDWEIAMNTYLASPGYTNQYLKQIEDKNGSSRFLTDAAKLGRGDDLSIMFPAQFKRFFKTPNLLHDEGDYYSAEGFGTFSAALHVALNQSIAPTNDGEAVIRVFPAWPKAWDAKYKLLAKDGFLVSSSIQNEYIEYIEIESQLGGECRVRSPWDGKVELYRNGKLEKSIGGKYNDLMKFETEIGDRIVLVAKGTTPDEFKTDKLEVFDYVIINDDESNIKYEGKWKSVDSLDSSYLCDSHITNEADASVEYLFFGSGVDVIGELGSDCGKVDVYIDDSLIATIDCASTESKTYQLLYSNLALDYAGHRIKLVNKEGKKLSIDGFRIWSASNEQVVILNDTDDRIKYSGENWNYRDGRWMESDLMNDVHVTAHNDDFCEFTFTGTGIGWITEICDDLGKADIYIDGEFKETVDCFNLAGRVSRQIVYIIKDLEYGEHTIKIVKQSGPYMIIDGFKIWLEERKAPELEALSNKYLGVGNTAKKSPILPLAIGALAIACGVVIAVAIKKIKRKKKNG